MGSASFLLLVRAKKVTCGKASRDAGWMIFDLKSL